MNNYVGIDLGTTNSAICSYDGEASGSGKARNSTTLRLPPSTWTARQQVRRHARLQLAAHSPDNAAVAVQAAHGHKHAGQLPAVNLTMTPEECSAEILRVLFGYLPEEMRNDPENGTVITVPAAFNQMQKNATMAAAELAGIGLVALMQEPVAAVMSVMRARKADGDFVVFDLGGGTLDVAMAESIGGRVNLLAHGGIADVRRPRLRPCARRQRRQAVAVRELRSSR